MERISLNEVLGQLRGAVSRNYGRMFRSQTQLTTGQRLQRASDDPASARRIMDLTAQRASLQRHLEAGERGKAWLNTSTGTLTEMTTSLSRARELAVQGANGTLSAADRASLAAELDAILGSVVSAANTNFDGRPLFAGTDTASTPFQRITGADGRERVDYLGNDASHAVETAPGVFHELTLAGSRVFATGPRGATVIAGTTGALAGAGSDSGNGRDNLLVRHTQTLFGSPSGALGQDPVSGLRPGSSSVNGDTVLGNGSSVVLSTDASGNGSISLNGGTAVNFTAASTNLEVTGPGGERIFIDASALAPNLSNVNVAMSARGSLSTDGGQTSVAIDFTNAAQQVVDSETGAVLHVDSRGINRAGTAEVTYGGSSTVFDALIALRDTLANTTLSASETSARLNAAMTELDRGSEGLSAALAELGGRTSQIQQTAGRLEDLDVTLESLRSREADVDMAEVLVHLKQEEGLYNASLMMAARVQQLSLLNWL
jgi:flagellar hook-associated protein 3 FlgL